MTTFSQSLMEELKIVEIVRRSPYNEIYKDGEYYVANLYDGTVTMAESMEQLRKKLAFIAKTECL